MENLHGTISGFAVAKLTTLFSLLKSINKVLVR
jgi:hypothetical protein